MVGRQIGDDAEIAVTHPFVKPPAFVKPPRRD